MFVDMCQWKRVKPTAHVCRKEVSMRLHACCTHYTKEEGVGVH
jgi:hypothetical protein